MFGATCAPLVASSTLIGVPYAMVHQIGRLKQEDCPRPNLMHAEDWSTYANSNR